MSELTRSVLVKYWGYPSFRPMQEDIVDAVIDGRDTLALLPTGGGKSICFQVPALAMDGVCIVVTPLISLMKDQVQHLKNINIPAAAIYSGMHPSEVEIAYNKAVFGNLKFLYVSPERLMTDAFIEAVKKMKVCLLAIDESHCISQWGYDFRPPYLKIAEIRPYIPNTPVLALTATATPNVVEDIQLRLGFKEHNVFQTSYERKNVTYNVIKVADKYGLMYRLFMRMQSGSGIVYVRSRKRTKVIADWLQSVGISATFYHAGIDAKTRDERQKQWMDGRIKVIVATNAFGMGIDKPDVRMVIHMDLPDSLEAYFQEAGRAGRDLKPSEAFLLVAESDIKQLKDNLQQSYPELERIKTIYDALGNYLQIPVGAGNGQSYPFDMNEFANSYGFSLLEVFNSLKLMEREGFFALSEAMESPSQLFIKASREDLYRFQVEYAEFDAMIKYLLRNYPGILSDFVKIKEEQISHKMGIDVTQVEQTLKNLEKYNFLTYIQRNGKPQIQYLTERQDTRHFALSDEVYKDRKDDATRRVQAVIDFVNNDSECRSVQLLRYFGEKIKTRCGRCDVCSIRNQMKINDEEYKNISELILDELKKRVVPLYETPSLAKNYLEEKVLETVRWMLDNGIIEQDENGNLKEKGRQWSLF
ncbi:MAG: RecQ family ATP-dependent DNA helicase [Bacteroidales bacterium]|nr:RecQ family ATP-dependent DNA helicase [Bacteroidales bacterium]MBO7528736.1 RecQ family ATP-dependent DNA helicase [Bacteroidales bacterium]MBQ3843539.1 RecQ family ATP-dependent DNA helicase [Bacteroidales bacterium]